MIDRVKAVCYKKSETEAEMAPGDDVLTEGSLEDENIGGPGTLDGFPRQLSGSSLLAVTRNTPSESSDERPRGLEKSSDGFPVQFCVCGSYDVAKRFLSRNLPKVHFTFLSMFSGAPGTVVIYYLYPEEIPVD